MPDSIYLEHNLTNANVVLFNGDCYEKIGVVEHQADVFAIQGEFETCEDCVGRGSSSMGSIPPTPSSGTSSGTGGGSGGPTRPSSSSWSSGSSDNGGNSGASSGSAKKKKTGV